MKAEVLPSVDQLLVEFNKQHQLVKEAAHDLVEQAIAAGSILLQIKEQIPHGQWLKWLEEHFPGQEQGTLRVYMRLARYQERVRAVNAVTMRAAINAVGGARDDLFTQEMRGEAQRLAASGMSRKQIAEHMGLNKRSVLRLLDPQQFERQKQRERERSRKALKVLKENERKRSVTAIGGDIAAAYAYVRKALVELDRASPARDNIQMKASIDKAMTLLHEAEDQIVAASKASGIRQRKQLRKTVIEHKPIQKTVA